MVDYVAGFMFSAARTHLALVEKRKPAWQHRKLNGIGGKIEFGELARDAMVREFREETGVETEAGDWERFAMLKGPNFTVSFFCAFDDRVYSVRTMETEKIEVLCEGDFLRGSQHRMIPNIKVLIPLALDTSGIRKPVVFENMVPEKIRG